MNCTTTLLRSPCPALTNVPIGLNTLSTLQNGEYLNLIVDVPPASEP